MAIRFKMYRALCSTPPDLERERCLFESVNARFAEQVTMPEDVLFPTASFRPGFDVTIHRSAAEGNIRMVDFFVQIYGVRLPDRAFQGFLDYALKCAADPAFPLRSVSVLFAGGADEDLRKLRETLAAGGQCQVREYQDEQDLDAQLWQVLESWYQQVRPGAAAGSGA